MLLFTVPHECCFRLGASPCCVCRWREQLIQADFNVSRTKGGKDFADGSVPKPLLVGVGGYGLVQLAFLGDWGIPYALKRQNIRMVEEKKHTKMAKLEWKCAI